MKKDYLALGMMSGTSLDGLDIAACHLSLENRSWNYQILAAQTFDFPPILKERITLSHQLSARDLYQLDHDFGKWMGETAKIFTAENHLKVDFIASHGHTVFHDPKAGVTVQIGHGADLARVSGKRVICDFRTADVAAGGEGAPLVPIGDRLLFSEFDCCINLGGFANCSFEQEEKRVAYDISPANIIANLLAKRENCNFDENGTIGRSGTLDNALLEQLNSLDFYTQKPPKSLGREWVEKVIIPLINSKKCSTNVLLNTWYEHVAYQIERALTLSKSRTALFTGGGVHNSYLMERINYHAPNTETITPDFQTIDFKEALIFSLLGALRIEEENNCLPSATGAKKASCGGAIYLP